MKSVANQFSWRQNNRRYSDMILAGYETLITSSTNDEVSIVTHDLHRVDKTTLTWDQFHTHFMVDFELPVSGCIRALKLAGNTMTMTSEALQDLKLTEASNQLRKTMPEDGLLKTKECIELQKTTRVWVDFNRHSCVEFFRKDGKVHYIPMASSGLELLTMEEKDFEREYKPLEKYPAMRAIKLYAESARHLSATTEAMQMLGKFFTITSKDIKMATTKKALAPKAEKVVPVAKKVKATPAKTVAKTPVKTSTKHEVKKVIGGIGGYISELLKKGMDTNAILDKVKDKFPTASTTKNSVAFYRSKLKSAGEL